MIDEQAASVESDYTKFSTNSAGLLLNRFGLITILIILVLAAWAGQTVIVVLLGLVFASAGLARLWSRLSLQGVRCQRSLSNHRVFPDETVELKLRIVNRKPLPLPWLEVQDEIPSGFGRDTPLFPGSKPGFGRISKSTSMLWYSAISWKYHLLCNKRGYYPLGPLTVTSGDIFGFYPATLTETADDHIIVYPRLYNVAQLGVPSLYPLGETRSDRRIFEDPSRSIGIRDYCPGDSQRRIHWKVSARKQELQVKVFEPTTTVHVAFFLAVDSFRHNGAYNDDELELGISATASLANYLIERGSQAGLWANCKQADTGEPARVPLVGGVGQLVTILEALAKVTTVSSRSFVDFLQAERKDLPLGTTLIVVLSETSDMLNAILTEMREIGYRLMVFQIGGLRSAKTIPGTAWHHIGQPGDLAEIVQGEDL
jgi:uncharacterized protein (DUF58 family)